MQFTLQLLGLIAVSLFCSGCWPMRFASSPGAAGIAIDAQSRAPIAGAEVFVSKAGYRLPFITNAVTGQIETVLPPVHVDQLLPPSLHEAVKRGRPPTVVTGPDGRFSIPPVKRWLLYVVPMDIFGPYGTLVVRREGYADVMRYLRCPPTTIDVGEVRLERKQ